MEREVFEIVTRKGEGPSPFPVRRGAFVCPISRRSSGARRFGAKAISGLRDAPTAVLAVGQARVETSDGHRHVVVDPEHVLRIPLPLHRREPLVGRARVHAVDDLGIRVLPEVAEVPLTYAATPCPGGALGLDRRGSASSGRKPPMNAHASASRCGNAVASAGTREKAPPERPDHEHRGQHGLARRQQCVDRLVAEIGMNRSRRRSCRAAAEPHPPERPSTALGRSSIVRSRQGQQWRDRRIRRLLVDAA